MVFCDPMNSTTLAKYKCDSTLKTMAVFIDAADKCHSLSGSDMNTEASYKVEDPKNTNGLQINYKGGETGYNFTLNMQCASGNNDFFNASITD
jgi:hypothetical protein